MVNALVSGLSGLGLSQPWPGMFCVVFLGKTLNSLCASLHPGFNKMGTGKLNAGGNPTSHPGGVEIFLVAPCYRNPDKLRPA